LALLILSLVASAACNKTKEEAKADPNTTTSPADNSGANAANPTGGTQQPGPAAPATATPPAADVRNGAKRVNVSPGASGGAKVDLQNETGKGSIDTTNGSTTIKGKNGKSIKLPGLGQ
jgi:hypothetical protein